MNLTNSILLCTAIAITIFIAIYLTNKDEKDKSE
jgi:hypothetical protein